MPHPGTRPTTRPPGRPRSESTRSAILEAAWSLVQASPISEISISGIAKEAGVGKATIYRWWPSRIALVCDAFLDRVEAATPLDENGTVVDVIRGHVTKVGANLMGPYGRVSRELIAACSTDAEGSTMFAERFIRSRREPVLAVIRRGISEGVFQSSLDPEAALDLLYGPMHYRLMVRHEPLTSEFVQRSLEVALRGMQAA